MFKKIKSPPKWRTKAARRKTMGKIEKARRKKFVLGLEKVRILEVARANKSGAFWEKRRKNLDF